LIVLLIRINVCIKAIQQKRDERRCDGVYLSEVEQS